MSYFPGAKEFYKNPLISFFNNSNSHFDPYTFRAKNLFNRTTSQASYTISILPRIKIFKQIETLLQYNLRKQDLPYSRATQLTYYQPIKELSDYYYTNAAQKDLKYIVDAYRPIGTLEGFIKAKVSNSANTLNEFLKSLGSTAKILPFPSNSLGAVALFDMILPWIPVCTESTIGDYKSFDITESIAILSSLYFYLPIIEIQTKIPDIKIYIEMTSGSPNTTNANPFIFDPENPYKIFNEIIDTRRNREFFRVSRDYIGARIPQIATRLREDTQHMMGFKYRTRQNTHALAGFVQETQFTMDHKGIGVRSFASGVDVNKCQNGKENFENQTLNKMVSVNTPFLLYVMHTYSQYPLFVGFFNTDSWVRLN